MNVSGMLYGAKMLKLAEFPSSEVLGPEASENEIHSMIERFGSIFIKPIFRGGIGKKGKSGLIGHANDLKSALAEKERLYFASYKVGDVTYKSRGLLSRGRFRPSMNLFFDYRFDALPCAGHDAHASWRHGDRGTG
jgi:hypothetical protein